MPDAFAVAAADTPGLAVIQARKGVEAATIGGVLGVTMPVGAGRAAGAGRAGQKSLNVIGMGQGAWLAVCEQPEPQWPAALDETLTGLASVTDQSAAYCVLRLTGEEAAERLQRGVSIDLHPDAFGPDSAATTVIDHIGVVFWRRSSGGFDLAVQRSYAASLRRWIAVNWGD